MQYEAPRIERRETIVGILDLISKPSFKDQQA